MHFRIIYDVGKIIPHKLVKYDGKVDHKTDEDEYPKIFPIFKKSIHACDAEYE